jgi:glutathione synthase/RimK-type ligase-like ATP-grasp enzyme
MKPDTVLIVTNKHDEHACYVIHHLNKYGIPVFRLNTEDFPTEIELNLTKIGSSLHYHGRTLYHGDIMSCWYRRPTESRIDPSITDAGVQTFVRDESWFVLNAYYRTLNKSMTWVSHPDALARAKFKPVQLHIAKRTPGFFVPRTLITNSPKRAKRFLKQNNNKIIVKVAGRGPVTIPSDKVVYSNLVTSSDTDLLDAVIFAPHLLQEYVEKAFEVRLTIIGKQVFAAKIDSQSCETTKIDWRRPGIADVKHEPIEPPEHISKGSLLMLERFGLNYGAFDFIVTPRGDWVFLELNPNGQFLWIEELTGLPMTHALIQLLRS